ncbi:NAD(P)-dependent oxidoreductase [Gammaproteobacteria bacterium]|nr:NAD(P)-dependent oxidoreductase [Gammaproteobacteria bacterium]MDC1131198.1 NAD(P)-dependent oxidoreductase [Gammaproteobacteria bacterium]
MPKSKKKYLFIGLGTMGYPMAGHLSKNKDLDLYVYNRNDKISDKWVNEFDGSKFILNNSSNIQFNGLITCLKDDDSIVNMLVNKKLLSYLKKNSFIIDHSTTSLELIDKIVSNQNVIVNNISFFDAPISGGQSGAENGSLSVMFGGPLKKISTIKKIMSSYSSSTIRIGPSGHGQLTKMVNQLCIAGLLQGLSEGMALGMKRQLNMNKVFDAISKGAAQSWQMDNRFKTMVKGQFDFGFAVDLMIKDLKIALRESENASLDLNITKAVLKKYEILSDQDDGRLDTSSLLKNLNT